MELVETLHVPALHFTLLPPRAVTAQLLLLPSQSINLDLQHFLYSSPGLALLPEPSLKESSDSVGRIGKQHRRVLVNSGDKPEYVGVGMSQGGGIVALRPEMVCEEGIFVKEGNLLVAFGGKMEVAE